MKSEEENNIDTQKVTVYEIGYLLVPLIAEEDVSKEVTAIKDVLDEHNARTVSEGWPERKVLAYAMEKETNGVKKSFDNAYFGWIKFEALPGDADMVKTKLTEKETMLRFLMIKTVKEDTVERKDILPRREQGRRQESDEKAEPISEEALDKTIDDLVVE